jgi:ubiquinone biosynthesis monooxygenase Coq7
MGYSLGFAPTLLLGARGFYPTIDYVETFVQEHYNQQIRWMSDVSPTLSDGHLKKWSDILAILQESCADEKVHCLDARSKTPAFKIHWISLIWKSVVINGSKAAVWASKRI